MYIGEQGSGKQEAGGKLMFTIALSNDSVRLLQKVIGLLTKTASYPTKTTITLGSYHRYTHA